MSAHVVSRLARRLPVVFLLIAGCGGGAQETAAPSAPAPSPAAVEPPAAPEPAASAAGSAPDAAPEPSAAPAAAADPAPASEAQRELKYIQSPDGLRVEILGVKFVPKVEAVRTGLGFVVKVTLSATASENRTLLAPKNGALAFAGNVKRAGQSEPEHFGDEREGDGEEPLPAGTSVKLTREWPGKLKVRPLGNGDSLELDVALWGLGTTPDDRRPVKQFLRVKAKVEKWKGRASVEPPPGMKGKK
jgi:hypothetical protein